MEPLAALIPVSAIAGSAWVAVTWMGLKRERLAAIGTGDAIENERLVRENEDLRQVIDRLEARMAVLERIATDPAERTLREIEELR